ncbi:MAG: rRNA ((1915)-N(3))-methyltransferase RlmH [Solirubrobacterales bacterium]|nr:rRNA ((1915)-N(3))-methyltransferase RlmH [Solirubrobacterales bacterium]
MRLIVLSVGRLRPPYADDVQHYEKLLSRYAKLELIEVREDEQLHRRVPERAFVSQLHSEGRTYDSVAFSAWVDERRVAARDVCFVIGGAYGLEDDVQADHRLSFGPLTLPHQLARVVLLEQLYRAHKILAGEPYHH